VFFLSSQYTYRKIGKELTLKKNTVNDIVKRYRQSSASDDLQ
jgi:hypothetical protein